MINFFILINTTEGKDTTYGMKKFRLFASWQVPWSCISKESPRTETMKKRRKEESRNWGENETMRFERRKMMYHCNNSKNKNANKGFIFLEKVCCIPNCKRMVLKKKSDNLSEKSPFLSLCWKSPRYKIFLLLSYRPRF